MLLLQSSANLYIFSCQLIYFKLVSSSINKLNNILDNLKFTRINQYLIKIILDIKEFLEITFKIVIKLKYFTLIYLTFVKFKLEICFVNNFRFNLCSILILNHGLYPRMYALCVYAYLFIYVKTQNE